MSTVGVEQAGGRRRYASFVFIAGVAMAATAHGQSRVVERHRIDEPEGRLLGFYAAALAFTSAGAIDRDQALALGLEASYVPYLDDAQRRPSIDKPEATNLAPVFPRPRLSARLPFGVIGEASWVPPVPVFDVRANLFAFAASRTVASIGGVDLTPRIWTTFGRVRGAMTCNADALTGRSADLDRYYALVCHGRESDDWFEPRLAAVDVHAVRAMGAWRVSVTAGARHERTRFDIGVRTFDGRRDPDHPILEMRGIRPEFSLGAAWRTATRWSAGAEAFYAPGSLLTARLSAQYVVRP